MGATVTKSRYLNPLKRFFRMLSLDRKDITLVIIYAVFAGLISQALPLGVQAIINLIAIGQPTTSWIVLCFVVAVATAVVGIMKLMQVIIVETIQQRVFARSSFEMAFRIPRFKMEGLQKEYAPELANRFFDTLSVQKGLPKIIIDIPAASLQILFGLILLALYHPFFVAFGIVLLLLLIAIIVSTYNRGLNASLKESKYKYRMAYWLEELGRTMGSFKLAGRTQYPLEQTDELVEGYLKYRQKHFNVFKAQFVSNLILRTVATLALLLIGGLLVVEQQMNIGQFVASEIIIIVILNALEKIILTMESIFDVLTALEKIGTVTDIELDDDNGLDFKELVEPNKGIEVKIRNLSYPNDGKDKVLKNINIDIKPGEHICIAGFSASGKTTLLKIILGLYENYSGSIFYNGVPRSDINIASLRSYMGDYITEEHLFNGTLWQNICMGRKDVTTNDIMEVCELVGLTQYLEGLPNGLNTVIPSDGQDMPQSTIKKIIMARCIVDRPLLLATEPLINNLEVKDKYNLLDILNNRKYNWTVISVSRNSYLASQCDKVIVLKEGEIIFSGNYESLSKEDYFHNLFDDVTTFNPK